MSTIAIWSPSNVNTLNLHVAVLSRFQCCRMTVEYTPSHPIRNANRYVRITSREKLFRSDQQLVEQCFIGKNVKNRDGTEC